MRLNVRGMCGARNTVCSVVVIPIGRFCESVAAYEVEPDGYGAQSEYADTMFADSPRKQLADLTNKFLNNLAKIAEEEGGA
jgi:hypothetical protein